MKNVKRFASAILALTMLLTAGCSRQEGGEKSGTSSQSSASQSGGTDQAAKPEDMGQVKEDLDAGLVPVDGSQVKDGVYDITVDSSSSMFNIVSCKLTVDKGQMTAVMTMGGTGYLKVFMGTGEEAVGADESDFIPFEETESGEHTFTVPVAQLNKGLDCAAFSKKKEQWYDRTLVFRADSLPTTALSGELFTPVESLNLADGDYTADVVLNGGSGRAGVSSPAKLHVEGGKVTATVVWSSSNYDYMKVDDVKYEPTTLEPGSTFEIPVTGFDWAMPVVADTVAMGSPHEISYTLTFDSASIRESK